MLVAGMESERCLERKRDGRVEQLRLLHVIGGVTPMTPRQQQQQGRELLSARRWGDSERLARRIGVSVWGASDAINPAGRGMGFSFFRSTQTSTIHPAAPRALRVGPQDIEVQGPGFCGMAPLIARRSRSS